MKPPDEDGARGGLDEAVDAEAQQGDASGGERGRNGDEALDDVPTNCQVLEPKGTGQQWPPGVVHRCDHDLL